MGRFGLKAALGVALIVPAIAAATPVTMVQQGRVLDASGAAINGPQSVTVTLYGAGVAVWTDTFTGVPVQDGFFAVVLGSGAVLQATDVVAADEVGVTLGGGAELLREALHSAPRAVSADRVSGEVQVTASAPACLGASDAGTLRWTAGTLQVCTGAANTWQTLNGPSSVDRVAFYAHGAASTATSQSPLVFSTETFDDGAGYNPATGIYTAPVSGTYVFSYNVVFGNGTTSSRYLYAQLQSNAAPGSTSWAGANGTDPTYVQFQNMVGDNSYQPSGTTQVVKLAAGQAVRVITGAYAGTTATVYPQSTSFSGFLAYR